MDGSIVGQARPGDILQLNDAAIVNANGWQWWQVINGTNGIAYVRSDVVGAPFAHNPPPTQQAPITSAVPNSDLTNTPRDVVPDMFFWAVPQSLGGYLETRCDAHYVQISIRYSGAYDCATLWRGNFDAVVADIHREQNSGLSVVYIAIAPNPPRVYLQDAYTAVAYADSGNYLAQALDDKTAVLLARSAAETDCGQSCNIHVMYYYQN